VREPLLNFVVAGGGFAGVETIAGMNDFLRDAIKFYPHLNEKMLRIVLIHSGGVILPELSERLGKYARQKLEHRGIEIRLNTRVTGLTDREVTLSDGTRIVTNTLVWTAGTAPNPMLAALPCAKERGKVLTDEFMRVPGFENVWAVGDCAAVPDVKNGVFFPPTAQHAIRQGKILAHNIAASVKGGRLRPFTFQTIGQLAALGKRTGVAQIFGLNFSGFVAWWLWRTIYLMKLPRFEKKLRVALDWTLDLLFTKDLVQFLTLRAPTISTEEEPANSNRRVATVR